MILFSGYLSYDTGTDGSPRDGDVTWRDKTAGINSWAVHKKRLVVYFVADFLSHGVQTRISVDIFLEEKLTRKFIFVHFFYFSDSIFAGTQSIIGMICPIIWL